MDKALNLRRVKCCANCAYMGGWVDNIWCDLHDREGEQIDCDTLCDDYSWVKKYDNEQLCTT